MVMFNGLFDSATTYIVLLRHFPFILYILTQLGKPRSDGSALAECISIHGMWVGEYYQIQDMQL